MRPPKHRKNKKPVVFFFIGVFIVSLTGIAYEISLTRIFSVKAGQHFTYLVISIAMLGYGAAGTFLRVSGIFEKHSRSKIFPLSSALFAISVFMSYLCLNSIDFDPAMLSWEKIQFLYLFLVLIIIFIPFFFAGLTISCAMYTMSRQIGRVYFFDLSGAGTGCLLPLMLFSVSGGGQVMIFILLTGLTASLLFAVYYRSFIRFVIPVLILMFIYPLISPFESLEVRVSQSRDLMVALRHSNSRILDTKWDAFTKIDIIDSPAVRYAPGLSLKYTQPLPVQLGITIDSGSLHAITEITPGSMGFLEHMTSVLAYEIMAPGNVFILKHSGGLDILSALHYSADQITASESNTAVSDHVRTFYENVKDPTYDFTKVTFIPQDGRSYLRSDIKKYDTIIISLTDILGASSGVFSSGEDHLLTKEAFTEYYEKLDDEGVLSMTGFLKPVITQEARIVATIAKAIPNADIMAIRSFATITTVIKKGRFTDEQIKLMLKFCDDNSFDAVWFPGMDISLANRYNRFPEPVYHVMYKMLLNDETHDQYIEENLFDISPVSDDSPFFHNYITPARAARILATVPFKLNVLLEGGLLVPVVTLILMILSALFILLPVIIKNRRSFGKNAGSFGSFAIIYYILIGAAYMLVEIPLIHRLTPVLGTPAHAMTAVLFPMLLSSGAGSFIQEKKIKDIKKGMRYSISVILIILILYAVFLQQFIDLLFSLRFGFKLLLIFLALIPPGFLMGMPFPLLMRHTNEYDNALIPWLFGANGCASVVFASFSTVMASLTGYSVVIMLAAGSYLLAMICGSFYLKASPVIGTNNTLSR